VDPRDDVGVAEDDGAVGGEGLAGVELGGLPVAPPVGLGDGLLELAAAVGTASGPSTAGVGLSGDEEVGRDEAVDAEAGDHDFGGELRRRW
jgi:hypothetical protein